jgi:predicted dehydrogenase
MPSDQGGIRLGLVGLGWGERVALAVRPSSDVDFVACHARSSSRREAFAARHAMRSCATYAELIADDSLHGVVIMTPNGSHHDLAVDAMRAGRHVLVTKPIATTLTDAADMIRVARETGRVLAVGHQSRRHPALRALKRLVDAGSLGLPHVIEGNTSSPTGLAVRTGDWRARPEQCPGGPLLQLGIHYVDNFQHLVGPVRTVSAWMGRTGAGVVDPDTATALFEFSSGACGYLGSSYVTGRARWIRVAGEAGAAVFGQDGSLILQGIGRERKEVLVPPVADPDAVLGEMLAEEVVEFAACIHTGEGPEIGGEAAARNLAVVLAAVESHRRRAPVMVDELMRAAGLDR